MVIDSSAAIEMLLRKPRAEGLIRRIEDGAVVHAPHLIDVEVAHALRRFVLRGELGPGRAASALILWRQFKIERHAHGPFLERIWRLRANVTAYDAAYVALAEALGTTLVTADRRLARAPGVSVPVEAL